MCDDIMEEVSGLCMTADSAVLRGYRRLCVKGEYYPAMVPNACYSVEGVVYQDIPQVIWSQLDRFEGKMYERKSVCIELLRGQNISAETYVMRANFTDCLDEIDWNFSAFLRDGKASFHRSFKG